MTDVPTLANLLADPTAVDRITPAEVPPLLGALAELEARLRLRMTLPPGNGPAPGGRAGVLTVAEVAEQLGIMPREVRRLFARPGPAGLPHVELGPKTKGVLAEDLAAFLARQRQEPPVPRRGRQGRALAGRT